MALCNEKTRSGKKCRAKAMANGKCAMHQSPDRAKELARRSVEARRKAIDEAQNRPGIVPPKSPEELVNQLAQIFADVGNGKIDVSLARTMANVGQVILKGLEIVDVKKELKEIEELLYGPFGRCRPTQENSEKKADSGDHPAIPQPD